MSLSYSSRQQRENLEIKLKKKNFKIEGHG